MDFVRLGDDILRVNVVHATTSVACLGDDVLHATTGGVGGPKVSRCPQVTCRAASKSASPTVRLRRRATIMMPHDEVARWCSTATADGRRPWLFFYLPKIISKAGFLELSDSEYPFESEYISEVRKFAEQFALFSQNRSAGHFCAACTAVELYVNNFHDCKSLAIHNIQCLNLLAIYRDLSHNNLSGSIPNSLGQLPSLGFLDLSSNNLSGPIPKSLLQKSQNGWLTLRIDNNPNLCTNASSCDPASPNKKKTTVTIVTATVTVGIALLALFVSFTIWYKRKARKVQGPQLVSGDQDPQTVWAETGVKSMVAEHQGPRPAGINPDPKLLLRDNHATDAGLLTGLHFWNFNYKELGDITWSFQNKIAEGGFGPVYAGRLDNGTLVAVKMRSQDSSQGDKEFWAEVKCLAMFRHENLVPLLGYCYDGEHLGLVYEYMAGGNVEQRLRGGTTGHEDPLTWPQRLKIALDSARGLHYLHSALSTPLIHRDVKARNILLTEKLEAKISDLGLARAISSEGKTHTITVTLSGTPGYVDPEYLKAGELRGKTDVYSFGIVLLVLITARPTTVVVGDKHVNIADWVRKMISQDGSGRHGDIASVIDHSIRDHYDIVSALKVAELALRCAEREDVHARPTMAEVVAELEALQQPNDDGASAAGTSCCSVMAEEEDDNDEAAVAGLPEVVQTVEEQ